MSDILSYFGIKVQSVSIRIFYWMYISTIGHINLFEIYNLKCVCLKIQIWILRNLKRERRREREDVCKHCRKWLLSVLVSVISALTSHALLLRSNGHYPSNADLIKHANRIINGSASKAELVTWLRAWNLYRGIGFLLVICERSYQDL